MLGYVNAGVVADKRSVLNVLGAGFALVHDCQVAPTVRLPVFHRPFLTQDVPSVSLPQSNPVKQ